MLGVLTKLRCIKLGHLKENNVRLSTNESPFNTFDYNYSKNLKMSD